MPLEMPATLTDEQQRTLREPAEFSGLGLFTGVSVTARILPADSGHGLIFRRTDLENSPDVPALIDHVVDRPRRTVLERGGATIETVEHCLSALVGLGVDNAVIEVNGLEMPAGDSSAKPYTDAIRAAGLVEQDAPRRCLEISETVTVREGGATLAALPSSETDGCEYLYVLDYGASSPIHRQMYSFPLDHVAYLDEIAPARTFSSQSEAEAMWRQGMFRHLTVKDMLVIGESGPVDNAFRFEDEPVRHKVLDLMGDLALVGRPIRGRIVAVRSGHALNHRLARELRDLARRRDQGKGPIAAPAMDIRSIMRLLPHRYPMILVDRVLEMEGDERAVGVKNVTINEPFFQGHYPEAPIMPGVLIVEAMCQLAGLMLSQKLERTGKIAMLLSLDRVKLRKPVVPGDQLVIETRSLRTSPRFGDVQCRAFVGGELAAEARVRFMMVDAEDHG